ncbi:ComEC/Rec2 family competence protein [Flaviflexus sp.]|uniref:ComEC/Rec2 family competence protein n=1 Tax=Flaviflexus sp. TaxID=1969482 RepID=UPI003F8F4816
MTHGDVRILLAAGAWWVATIGVLLEGAGFTITVSILVGGLVFVISFIRKHIGKGKGEAIIYWWPTLVVVVLSAILASGVVAAHNHLGNRGILSDLISAKAVVTVQGEIASYPNPAGDQILRTLSIEHVEGRGQVSGSYSSVTLLGGDNLADFNLHETVDVLVRLEPTDPGSREVAWATVLRGPTLIEEADPVSRWIANRAAVLDEYLEDESPAVRGLVPGVAIGDDSGIPEEDGDALAAVNLTHLTAVSGSHVSMITAIVLGIVGRKRKVLAVTAAAGVLGVLVLATGAQPSVMRAAVMGVVVLAGVWMRRPASALPALGASIILLLAVEPTLALAYGFILSVVSTAAIIVFSAPASALLAPVLTVPGANLLAVPVVAHLACSPIILLLTDTASLWSALANAVVAPVVPIGTILALGAIIAAPVPYVGQALGWMAARCVSWIDIVAGEMSGWWGSGIDGRLVIVVYAGILLLAWPIVHLGVKKRTLGIGALGIAVLYGVWRLLPTQVPDWDIVQCDVGQGAATLFKHEGAVYLVDTGTEDERLGECLDAAGTHVDIVVLTHMHADHAGNLDTALSRGAQEIWVGPGITPEVEWQIADSGTNVPIRELRAGDNAEGIEILWPDSQRNCYDDACINNQSLVLRVSLGQTLLIPGDLETDAQRTLSGREIAADIVLVPHHGSSKQDDGFALAVGAETALLSYGENTYGHPAPSTIDLYSQYGNVLATEDGDIFIKFE